MLVILEGDEIPSQQIPLVCFIQNPGGVNYEADTEQNLLQPGQSLPQPGQTLPQPGQTLPPLTPGLQPSGQNLGHSVPYQGQNLPPPPPLVRHGHISAATLQAQEVNTCWVQRLETIDDHYMKNEIIDPINNDVQPQLDITSTKDGHVTNDENMDHVNKDIQPSHDKTTTEDNLIGYIIAMTDGVETDQLAMCSNVFTIGSARSNDIILETAAYHEVLLQADQFGKVVMYHHDAKFLKGRYLEHNEDFAVGNEWFKWKYPQDDHDLCEMRMDSMNEVQPMCDKTTSKENHDLGNMNVDTMSDIQTLCEKTTSEAPDSDSLYEMLNLKDDVVREVYSDCLDEMMELNDDVTREVSKKNDSIADAENVLDTEENEDNINSNDVPDIEDDSNINSDDVSDIEEDDSNNDSDYVPDIEEDDSNIDSDYVPESEPESSSVKQPDHQAPVSSKRNIKNAAKKPVRSDKGITNSSSASSDHVEDISVQKSKNSKDRRVWDKMHFCIYCGKSSTSITKHYLLMHKNEDDVKAILSLKKGSKERSLELVRLRNKGDYQHNLDVLSSRKGTLISLKRNNGANVDDYLPCEDCLGFFLKDSLWRHRKSCPFKTGTPKHGSKIQATAKILMPSSVQINENFKENVIKGMSYDNVSNCAKNDSIIFKIGENMFIRNGQNKHYLISQKMRELARFLMDARKENQDIKCLSDIIDPGKFDVAIKATKRLCGFNQSTHRFANPSLALKIGHQLKKCARIKKSDCLMNKSSGREDADNFLALMENEWIIKITSNALRCITATRNLKDGDSKEQSKQPSPGISFRSSASGATTSRKEVKYQGLKRKRKSTKSVSVSIDHVSDSDESDISTSEGFRTFPSGRKIHVQTADKAKGIRSQKKQACFYCGALSTKLSRHLSVKHAEEVEVANIMKLKKKSRERRDAWIKLASKGNFAHNLKVKENGSGLLIPKYRPVKNSTDSKYLPCEYCFAYIIDEDLWKHHRSCVSKPKGVKSDGPIRNARHLLPKQCSEQLYQHVVSKLRNDDVTSKIKSDALILEFGQRQFDETDKHDYKYTGNLREQMRILARCVIAIQKQDNAVTSLSDVITVSRWKLLIETVKREAGFDVQTEGYERPYFVIKCELSLKKCATILRDKCNENGDGVTKEKAVRFLEMFEKKWYKLIGAGVRKSLKARKCDKLKLLLLVEDVIKLSEHIDAEVDKVRNTDYSSAMEEAYVRMCKLTLAQVILFNRTRPDDVQSLTKEAFSKISLDPHVDEEVKSCLSEFEQVLCESHSRIEVSRKHGKKVTILFTPAMQENVKLILSLHESLGCSSRYVFVPLQGLIPYHGTKALREIELEAELMYAHRITSIDLRKQLSTLFQVLCLGENNQEIVAKLIGHDIKINRELYYLPEGMMEVAKVARLLHLINTGKISTVDGKSLDNINVDLPLEDKDDSVEKDAENVDSTSANNQADTFVSSSASDSEDSEDQDEMTKKKKNKSRKIQVQTADKAKGIRSQKKQACIYCGELSTKLSRHLSVKHAEEVEVAKIMKLKKKSKERRDAWIKLASKGNFAHNQKVKEKGSGLLITKYRPLRNSAGLKYLPCEYCLAYIIDRDLWKHHKTCNSKPKEVKSDGPIRNARLLLPKNCSEELYQHVVSKLRDDFVTSKIKSDALILEFGQRHYDETVKHEQIYKYISQIMRILARCVIAIHKQDNAVKTLSDVITASRWKLLLETVQKEAGFDVATQEYKRPSFVIRCGLSLKKCATILKDKCNENGDEITKEKVVQFLEIYEKEWYEVVGAGARDSLNARKCTSNKVKLLPLVEDVIKLIKHIEAEVNKVKNTDYSSAMEEAYVKMCKLTLAQVILFNKTRAGDAQSLTKEVFSKVALNPNVDKEVGSCLSKFEHVLCESHLRVETRGKYGRKVTILFTPAMHENVKFILSLHESLNCSSRYVFVPPKGLTPYRGTQALRKIAYEAELMCADMITFTNLRKQLATLLQVLCLSENNQEIMAKFTGRDINIQKEFHSLPEGMVEVAKVARLIHLINTGKISTVDGNALKSINVDLPLEDDDDDSDEEDADIVGSTPASTRKQGQTKNLVDRDADENDDDSRGETGQLLVAKKKLRQKRNLIDFGEVENDDDSGDETWQPPMAKKKSPQAVVSSASDSEDLEDQEMKTKKKKNKKKQFMTYAEREALTKAFEKNILSSKVPGKLECSRAKRSDRTLARFEWKKLKYAVYNIILRNRKNSNNSKQQ